MHPEGGQVKQPAATPEGRYGLGVSKEPTLGLTMQPDLGLTTGDADASASRQTTMGAELNAALALCSS
jgi:hypothetical protein